MNVQNETSDTNRIQRLAALLTLEDVEDVLLKQLKWCAHCYTNNVSDPRIALEQESFSELITMAYNLSRLLEADAEWFESFHGVIHELDKGAQHPDLAGIFELVLIYLFATKAQLWQKHAIKLAACFRKISATGLAAENIVRELERVIAYETLD
jgi:hypothetical protein